MVGQLDFDNFVADSSLNKGTVTAGNPDLNPEQAWVTEAAVEQRFWTDGVIVVTYRRSALDDVIDRQEVEIEEECLKILALHQPVASDLRWVIAVLKINNDLERIADIAVNIAERVPRLVPAPPSGMERHLQQMGDHAIGMLRQTFDALAQRSPDLAREVVARDEALDQMHRQTFATVEQGVVAGPVEVAALLLFLSVSRDLERVGDHVTNIAEDLIYLFEGAIIRHTHHPKTERP